MSASEPTRLRDWRTANDDHDSCKAASSTKCESWYNVIAKKCVNTQNIEIALDGIENEELIDPKKCYQYIKDAMKDEENTICFYEVQFMPRFDKDSE